MRDYVTGLIHALAMQYVHVHDSKGYDYCAQDGSRYMDCWYESFTSCQEEWPRVNDVGRVGPVTDYYTDHDQFPHWLWDKMAKNITIRDSHTGAVIEDEASINPRLLLVVKLSALRSMLYSAVFRPRPRILKGAQDMIQKWQEDGLYNKTQRGVTVQIRRTDKAEDNGKEWGFVNTKSAHAFGPLVQHIEKAVGYSFKHFFIMSDNPFMPVLATWELKPYFMESSVHSLYSDSICQILGHPSRHRTVRALLHRLLMCNVPFGGHLGMSSEVKTKLYVSRKGLHLAFHFSLYLAADSECLCILTVCTAPAGLSVHSDYCGS